MRMIDKGYKVVFSKTSPEIIVEFRSQQIPGF